MEQVIFGGYHNLLHATNVEYNSLVGGYTWNAIGRYKLVSTDGVIKYLRVKLLDYASGDPESPGVGTKYTFTLMLNGAPTALTFEIADTATSGSDMVHEIDVTGGDYISLRCAPDNTPTTRGARWACVFEGGTVNESLILGGTNFALDSGSIEYGQVMSPDFPPSSNEDNNRQVIPTAGTIKNFYIKLDADPGDAPDAYRFTLRKNGVSQALTVTITADDTTGSDLANTVDVVAGDIVTLMFEPLDGPAATPRAAWGMTFVADIDGESIVIGGSYQGLDTTALSYQYFSPYGGTLWDGFEHHSRQLGQGCILKKLHILLSPAPGVGKKYDITIRIAGADSNVVVTIDGENTTGNSGALTDTVALDEYVNLKAAPGAAIPAPSDAYWGLVSVYTPPPPPEELENKSANMAAKMVAAGVL